MQVKSYAEHFSLENVCQNAVLHCLCFLLRKKHSSTKCIFIPTDPFARKRDTKNIFAQKTRR